MAVCKSYSELEIVNFSCWNLELHGECIGRMLLNQHDDELKLYPRGLNGVEDRIVVGISGMSYKLFANEIWLITADGSVIWTQQVEWEDEESSQLLLPPGPKFDEVVAHIRRNEFEHGDRLNLRLRLIDIDGFLVEHVCATIDMSETSLKLYPIQLLSGGTIEPLCNWRDGKNSLGDLRVVGKGKTTELQLNPCAFHEDETGWGVPIFLRSLLRSDGTGKIHDVKEHLFKDHSPFTIIDFPKIEEIVRTNREMHLRLKIINGKINTKKYRICDKEPICIAPATSVVFPEARSSKCQSEDSVNVLLRDLKKLYQKDLSDFQLKCDDFCFPVHRNILSAKSPVFKTMLSNDTAASGTVDITDLDPSTLGLFLIYLYSGIVKDLQGESALKLCFAADKYQVPSLKRGCVKYLRANVSFSSVCDILSVGYKCKAVELIYESRNFILKHYIEVLKSEEWKSLVKTEPLLAANTLTYFGEKGYLCLAR